MAWWKVRAVARAGQGVLPRPTPVVICSFLVRRMAAESGRRRWREQGEGGSSKRDYSCGSEIWPCWNEEGARGWAKSSLAFWNGVEFPSGY